MTKLGPKRIHEVRVRGGNLKHRAMRLDSGNFAWGSEHCTRKTRIIDVVRISGRSKDGNMDGRLMVVLFGVIDLQRHQQRVAPNQDLG